jgi:hypothetical protein
MDCAIQAHKYGITERIYSFSELPASSFHLSLVSAFLYISLLLEFYNEFT